ncbi:MAG: anti-virulence regulator CigR family protein [Pseudohongiellaceae bacterium]|nr:anti-virulence regulator CigR family protein [Pseudohongiellaceae bacterium]
MSHTKQVFRAAGICCLGLLLSSCAELGGLYPSGTGPMPTQGSANSQKPNLSISREQAQAIAIASGISSQQGLPPGIARRVAKGKPLPPGIAKNRLPQSMINLLPNVADHEWLQLGRDLVLVAVGTMVVVEIFEEVFS